MLVLTRKYQEKIRIGDGITITVLRAKGKAVRLGIEAPADVPVIRGELSFDPAKRELHEGGLSEGDTHRDGPRTAARQGSAAQGHRVDFAPPDLPQIEKGTVARRVSLHRVPREKAAEVLPQLLTGHGPLRAMLETRAGTL